MFVKFDPKRLGALAVVVVSAPKRGAVVVLVLAANVLPVEDTPKLKVEFEALGIGKADLFASLWRDVLNKDGVCWVFVDWKLNGWAVDVTAVFDPNNEVGCAAWVVLPPNIEVAVLV